jgi:hypothetical protein
MPNENTQKIEQPGSAQEHSEEASGSYSRVSNKRTWRFLLTGHVRRNNRPFWRKVLTIGANLPKKSRRSENEVKKMPSAMEATDIKRPDSEVICALTTRIAISEKAPPSRRQLHSIRHPLQGAARHSSQIRSFSCYNVLLGTPFISKSKQSQ